MSKVREKHGMTRYPEYTVWQRMKQRCTNPKQLGWADYGGRGIMVCDRWLTFGNFIEDMGLRPGASYCIERIDNDGNYEPSNCQWVTRKQQHRNTRRNIFVTHNGITLTASDWADRLGIKRATLLRRLRIGFPVEQALSTDDKRFYAKKGEHSYDAGI